MNRQASLGCVGYVVAARHANISGRTCILVDPCSVVHLALKCSDIVEHVGLRILLDDSALPQLFIAATDGKAPAIDGPGQVGRAADGR